MDIYNAIGYLGAALYIGAYILLNLGKINGNGANYITMNMVAALCVIFSLIEHYNEPSLVIQSTWVLISVFGLYRLWRAKRQKELTAPVQG